MHIMKGYYYNPTTIIQKSFQLFHYVGVVWTLRYLSSRCDFFLNGFNQVRNKQKLRETSLSLLLIQAIFKSFRHQHAYFVSNSLGKDIGTCCGRKAKHLDFF